MPTYTKVQLEQQYEKLPDVLKDAIFSVEIAEHMFELGKKHGLTMEKTGFAAEETGFVILGLLPPREFASSLASRLDIDKDKAAALASDINHQVFFPLRAALKDAHHIEVGESAIRAESALPRRTSGALISEITRGAVAPPSSPLPAKQNPSDGARANNTTSIKSQESRVADKTPASVSIDKAHVSPPPTTAPPSPRPPIPQAPQTPRSFIPPAATPRKPALITLAPLTPTTSIPARDPFVVRPYGVGKHQESRIAEKKTSEPIMLEPLKPVLTTPVHEGAPAAREKTAPHPTDVQNPTETPRPSAPTKPSPIILRRKISEDLQKEIAPLIGGASLSVQPEDAGHPTTESIIAEKLTEQRNPAPHVPSVPPLSPLPPTKQNPPDGARAGGAPPAPKPTTMPQPTPIKLEPLAPASSAPNSPPAPASAPPLGTAKVPAIDLRGVTKPPVGKIYDGFDPYKEPIE